MSVISEELRDAICDAGSPVVLCDFCKRTVYAGNGTDMDEGELERLEKNQQTEPDKYKCEAGSDSVSFGYIEGLRFVWSCDCKESQERLGRIEWWMLSHQRIILEFFRRRAKRLQAEANRIEHDLLTQPPPEARP